MKYIMNIAVRFVVNLYFMDLITVSISMKQTYLLVNSAYVNVFVIRLWVWHRICDETVGVTQDVMRLWVWHRICDETVGVTQDLW